VTTVMFLLVTAAFQQRFLWRDRQTLNLRAAGGFLKFIYWNPGSLLKIIPEYLDYYRPSFHPWQHDNRALISARVASLSEKELRTA
jgi:predicted metal-dependent hydrolase